MAVAIACLVPLAAGGAGALTGIDMLRAAGPASADVDSHFRYLSGLLLGIGLVYLGCIARIERRGAIMRALCLIIVVGGAARLLSAFVDGWPTAPHRAALVMELGVVPALTLWQARIARLFRLN